MSDIHRENKQFIGGLRSALYDIQPGRLLEQLRALFAPDARIHLASPFETLDGVTELYERAYLPLLEAVPDLERRDFIVMGGESDGENWVGCAGHYLGVFEKHWLDIPPTQHLVAMRYHEFFRIEDKKIVEMQALWDIPQVMMQSNAWPLVPALGVEWVVPGPASQDGILTDKPYDRTHSDASLKLVGDMLRMLHKSTEGVEAMELDRRWHPKMNWYGPAGIGSMRRISGFRSWHQIPFLKALPDRQAMVDGSVFFADGDYVGTTAWPNMKATVTGDGWLGIVAAGQSITMRSLDFWRCEKGMIRENWVLVDLLNIYDQLGVDVFSRMREFTVARQPGGLGARPK